MGTSPVPSLNTVTPVTKPKRPTRRDLSSCPILVYWNSFVEGSLPHYPTRFVADARRRGRPGGGFPVHEVIAPPIHHWSRLSGTPTSVCCRCSRVQVSRNWLSLGNRPQHVGGRGSQTKHMYKHIIIPTVYRITLRILLVGLHMPFSQSLPFWD